MSDSPVQYLVPAELHHIIKAAVSESLKEGCVKCPLPVELTPHLGHIAGVIHDVGDGDIRKGLEEARDNMRYVSSDRKIRAQIGSWLLKLVVVSLGGGLLTAAWLGIKGMVMANGSY